MSSKLSAIIFFSAISFALQAQTITLDPLYSIKNYVVEDYNHDTLDFDIIIGIENNTSDSLSIIWERTIGEDCPEDWTFGVYDKEFCYYHGISSNVNEEIGIDISFVLEPEENFEHFFINFRPMETPGCCSISFDFKDRQEPDVILETAIIDININSPDCILNGTGQEIAQTQLVVVYPNPSLGNFTLSNNDVIQNIDVYNLLGQKLKSFDYQNGADMDISELSTGMYSLQLKNKKGETQQSLLLSKI